MNEQTCPGCGLPMAGLRSDARYHPSCRETVRRDPLFLGRRRFWESIQGIRRRGPRLWGKPR